MQKESPGEGLRAEEQDGEIFEANGEGLKAEVQKGPNLGAVLREAEVIAANLKDSGTRR
ncbi:hypothetical protein HKBW3S43_00658 [Candidatus Hakubella thermalkaliphila]|uniref:Uncharacterized protein n=1 Tax=Candidatus Hakubella thermalkaliphila TaxID=2754717 RepID=A0A6V8QFE5_9ACTN|nr:hypothetical protein [Candidatus Hakubella thermalkaliphila]GFP28196.1 hypothetical protein HKBW3S33_01612 [Candidatus Hakubella thermalkaliphila]GFP34866.1 hypothetical protein HKBW3S43_00658 [Candidatus Hakubella thermalkaliphila]GFP43489.1 hypothetical protein HKBW3C_02619 [Candidatus Hakubella thermalkaliphila]